MDEDQILQSIIADPDLVDPSIDVSQLRQTTETSPRLLGDVSGIEGLKFDPTRMDYIRDLYSVYGGGLPQSEIQQDPTTMIPQTPVIDTPIDAGGGGNVDDSIITPDTGLTDFEQNLVDQGVGVLTGTPEDPIVVAPGEMPVTQEEMDEFNQIPVTQPVAGGITGDPIEVEDLINYQDPSNVDESGLDMSGTISGAPVIGDFEEPITVQGSLSQVQVPGLNYSSPKIGDPNFENYTPSFEPEQQNLIDLAFSKVGSTADDVMNDLSQIPGAVVDFVKQTVDIAGKKINVGATLLKAGINKIVGGPITLVFDALSAAGLEGGSTFQTEKARSIGLVAKNEYQDKYGINTQSMLGDYDQYNIDRVEQLESIVADQKSRNLTNTIQMRELEDRKEYNKISGVGGDVKGDQEGITIAEEIALQDRIDAGIDAADEEPAPSIDAPQGVDAGTADIQEFADIYEPPQDTGGDDRPSPNEAAGKAAEDAQRAAIQDAARAGMTVNEAKASVGMPANLGDTGGGDGGSNAGKIVCTMMNESYGFGSFRNKIWMKFHKNLSPEYQKGYHKLFLPLVKIAKTNKVIKKVLEHIAVHSTIDMRQATRGKKHLLGRVYRKIILPICYIVGKYDKR